VRIAYRLSDTHIDDNNNNNNTDNVWGAVIMAQPLRAFTGLPMSDHNQKRIIQGHLDYCYLKKLIFRS